MAREIDRLFPAGSVADGFAVISASIADAPFFKQGQHDEQQPILDISNRERQEVVRERQGSLRSPLLVSYDPLALSETVMDD